jgi:hypothetical protein
MNSEDRDYLFLELLNSQTDRRNSMIIKNFIELIKCIEKENEVLKETQDTQDKLFLQIVYSLLPPKEDSPKDESPKEFLERCQKWLKEFKYVQRTLGQL